MRGYDTKIALSCFAVKNYSSTIGIFIANQNRNLRYSWQNERFYGTIYGDADVLKLNADKKPKREQTCGKKLLTVANEGIGKIVEKISCMNEQRGF